MASRQEVALKSTIVKPLRFNSRMMFSVRDSPMLRVTIVRCEGGCDSKPVLHFEPCGLRNGEGNLVGTIAGITELFVACGRPHPAAS
jgi:hypothetical protein